MKKIRSLLLVLSGLLTLAALAQSEAEVIFGYDLAGNRQTRQITATETEINAQTEEKEMVMTLNNAINETSDFNVYPNPVKNILIIEAGDHQKHALHLYNFSGQLVLSREGIADRCELNLSHLGSGIYLLRIISPGKETRWKLIRE